MSTVVMRGAGTLEEWIEGLSCGCVCGGKTVVTAGGFLDLVAEHFPPDSVKPYPNQALHLTLEGLQTVPDKMLATYGQWIREIHEQARVLGHAD